MMNWASESDEVLLAARAPDAVATQRLRYASGCLPEDVNARWIAFRDAGRAFYGLVAIGPGSTAADGRRAMSVLNSFRPQPR